MTRWEGTKAPRSTRESPMQHARCRSLPTGHEPDLTPSRKLAVELVGIAAGELPPGDAMALPFKLRGMLVGVVLTTIGSLIFTGQGKPSFHSSTPTHRSFTCALGEGPCSPGE